MIDLDARRDVAERLEVAEELMEEPAGSGLDDRTRAKLRYLETLGTARLAADAKAADSNLAILRDRINTLKALARKGESVADRAEAELVLGEEFAGLKNEAQRKAWVVKQRAEHPVLASALNTVEHYRAQLAEAEATHEAVGRDYQLCLAELRTAEATLRFLAGQ